MIVPFSKDTDVDAVHAQVYKIFAAATHLRCNTQAACQAPACRVRAFAPCGGIATSDRQGKDYNNVHDLRVRRSA
jgi:hypothetical protein